MTWIAAPVATWIITSAIFEFPPCFRIFLYDPNREIWMSMTKPRRLAITWNAHRD